MRAAASVFASNGYSRTTINEIAEYAEVGVNTVYTVFGTKATLLAALINEALGDAEDTGADTAVQEAKSGPAVIRALAQTRRGHTERGYAIYQVGEQNSRADPQIAEAIAAAETSIRVDVRAGVQRLIELGVLAPGLDLDEGTDILYFFLGPQAWHSLISIGWTLDRARDFLAGQASRTLLRRGRSSSS